MKRAFAAGLIIVVFALCGCARQQYTTLEEAVRAGAKIEKGISNLIYVITVQSYI